ncbi:Spt4/RpoE2 zinc finger-domain-containing protein [Paraphoma chrysanthemicola]|uniref:Transcription elongation factor SPT4 n=1 Tax=Paraphoma chrysanthemicola TaxID=798071 RepID=A0A8K0RAY5_9PLEO|nr:Spt4/RpoE2 zinc finger-domain-containing protein [Paraphoma chrysanthemicola]
MARKGTAKVKKRNRYLSDSDSEVSFLASNSESGAVSSTTKSRAKQVGLVVCSDTENVDPAAAHDSRNLSTGDQLKPAHKTDQPRQDSLLVGQSPHLNHSPPTTGSPTPPTPTAQLERPAASAPKTARSRPKRPRQRPSAKQRSRIPAQGTAAKDTTPNPRSDSAHQSPQTTQPTFEAADARDPATMIQGGASIPPNQQRNMRACMICSIVRTQQQFLTQGCPNCEDIIELANNPEQINDCTSQVFEGLISVADTSRSWVARYQRLEGYVPGVYATQVEGILPEDILVAVENAGINYVPRDGSEQEMIGKD